MAQERGVVTASTLNVRPDPSTERKPVGQIDRGGTLDILDRSGPWYRIRKGSLRGWVHADYVRVLETEHASGFLHERGDLQVVSLAAPEETRIDTSGLASRPLQVARTWNRTGGLLDPVCGATGVTHAPAVAVLQVESSGRGFDRNGRMIIRFENHVFKKQWGAAGESTFPKFFRYDGTKPWTKQQFRTSAGGRWRDLHQGGAGSQDLEWEVFEFARSLDEPAALRSISMGAPQIMGFNHATVGYESPREMFDRFNQDERYHILAMFDFIVGPGTTSPMLEALRAGHYEAFATRYNGAGQAAVYGERIRQYAQAFEGI